MWPFCDDSNAYVWLGLKMKKLPDAITNKMKPLTNEQLEDKIRIAEKATKPWIKYNKSSTTIWDGKNNSIASTGGNSEWNQNNQNNINCNFIASNDPDTIKSMATELLEARKVIEFYANCENYCGINDVVLRFSIIKEDDELYNKFDSVSGKRARAHQEKWKVAE